MYQWHRPLVLTLLLLALFATTARAADRPNIIVILLDDMGWSDLGCYGGEVRTPNIDRLAAGGLRFTQFYNTGRCCPTRASLLTGLYPHQAGVGEMTFDRGVPGYRGQLNDRCVTIAEVLRSAGYHTAMSGKWHLSLTQMYQGHMRHLNNQTIRETFADPATYPVGRGFDEHYGTIWGVVNFFDPFSLVHNTNAITAVPDDYYITDALTDRAITSIDRAAREDRPLFLYLAHTAPHWPLHALPEDIDRYKDTYRDGWQAIRKARYQRQVDMGLIDPATTALSERLPNQADWNHESKQAWEARAMAVHAAMIDRVDQGVGRIIDALKARNMFDNTLIMLLSDNGASPERPGSPGFDRTSETRDGKPVQYFGRGATRDTMPGPETTYAAIGNRWANVANTPLRYWKATQHEGGIRTPLVVHWPAGLRTQPGAITHNVGHVMDLMPTCVELAGATYPDQYNDQSITPLEGRSLAPIFHGNQNAADAFNDRPIFFEHQYARAMRQGRWKLVSLPNGEWELYDLANDGSEINNLAPIQPQRVEEMVQIWNSWAHRAHVYPNRRE